jgi:hypothetical protein
MQFCVLQRLMDAGPHNISPSNLIKITPITRNRLQASQMHQVPVQDLLNYLPPLCRLQHQFI